MRNWLSLIALVSFSVAVVGCEAPCDRMCSVQADYVEACVAWTAEAYATGRSAPLGWDVFEDPNDWWDAGFGVGGAEEFAETCKADADARLAGLEGDDQSLVEQECANEAQRLEADFAAGDKEECRLDADLLKELCGDGADCATLSDEYYDRCLTGVPSCTAYP